MKGQSNKLNRIMKAAARFVLNVPKFSPITEAMISTLHWLPFPQRVDYKLAQLSYKCHQQMAPPYLQVFFTPVGESAYRSRLRSANLNSVLMPRIKTDSYGGRGFFYTGPAQWNQLPASLRNPTLSAAQFSSQLKTYLFTKCT